VYRELGADDVPELVVEDFEVVLLWDVVVANIDVLSVVLGPEVVVLSKISELEFGKCEDVEGNWELKTDPLLLLETPPEVPFLM
jgi:hypothetical protein